ncbi:NAD-dependent epimerase/dehydratase family protein [Sphingobium yanoikuyae]|uniref:NAD-dependent epimerase/dehydratase family protein n=1 Tax=Sphingobium yanoikuyae TaxID=13690 RepID=UPI0022DE75C6|nr:NAD-dependent epimerase/dehydratase family protein [Sphingobium yanoikuyae]WBQ19100.1 NAD-dependent epimerase/dehydratase family protein [Sphingobium yanoikuyae]
MTLLVTGASGFVGREVSRLLADDGGYGAVRLTDLTVPPIPIGSEFEAVAFDLAATEHLDALLEGVDRIIHLAAVPGGATEQAPEFARRINVDAPLAILEHLDQIGHACRFVYASSIAILGPTPSPVDDETVPVPATLYGAHKRMIEIALPQFARRGSVKAIGLRLPGIVARPLGPSGLASAFMSDLFHAALEQRPITLPVSADASIWILSARRAAWNLIHALHCDIEDGSSLTCPALHVTIGQLIQKLFPDPAQVRYAPDPEVQRLFGSQPALATPSAAEAGFQSDESLEALTASAFASIRAQAPSIAL